MNLYFWGTRGSLPASLNAASVRHKITDTLKKSRGHPFKNPNALDQWIDAHLPFSTRATYGTNTPCVQIQDSSNEFILCDAGSGLRDFSVNYMSIPTAKIPATFHIFLSHLHWDHIQGFPFFTPATLPNNHIIIHACHTETESALRQQMSPPFFPIDFDSLKANITFNIHSPDTTFDCCGFNVTTITQNHPGTSYGFRFEKNGKSIVYSTDCEHKQDFFSKEDYPFLSFYKNADLLILDGQYSLFDASLEKEDWGHSSNMIALELAARSQAKHLVLFHLEPTSSDEDLDLLLQNTREYHHLFQDNLPKEQQTPLQISLAYDSFSIPL